MTINFFEAGDIPQPKEKVKIEKLTAEVYPDRWRVKLDIHVTPFLVRPNLAVALVRQDDPPLVVSHLAILETMHPRMEFTLHIRYVDDPAGDYQLKARLYFEEGVEHPYDEQEVSVIVPPAEDILGIQGQGDDES